MAVTPGVGSVWQYTVHMQKNGQSLQTSTLLSPSSTPSPSDYLAFCAQFTATQYVLTSAYAALMKLCLNDTIFTGQTIQAIYPNRLVAFFAPSIVGYKVGTSDFLQPIPVNACSSVDRYSESGLRSGRGNLHPPGGCMDDLTIDGAWNAVQFTNLTTFANKWIAPLESISGSSIMYPVLWNPKKPDVIQRFIGHKPNPYVRTMRRRTVGRGI